MRLVIGFLFCLFFNNNLFSQEKFAEIGTSWTYYSVLGSEGSDPDGITLNEVELLVESIDTVDGIPCSRFDFPSYCLYTKGDSVVKIDPGNNRHSLLYDWSLKEGDTINFTNISGPELLAVIDSTFIFTLDTIQLRGQVIIMLESCGGGGVIRNRKELIVVESIGPIGVQGIQSIDAGIYTLFYDDFFCSVDNTGFCLDSYKSSQFSYQPEGDSCKLIMTNSIQVLPKDHGVLLFPNPADSEIILEIEGNLDPLLINIFDLQGSLLKSINMNATSKFRINTTEFNSGSYFLAIFRGRKLIYSTNFILKH